MKETAKEGLPHPHDLLVRNILGEPDLAADLFKNYLPDEWVSELDFDSLKRESTESINRTLSELLGDLRYSAKFKGTGRELNVFIFLEHQSQPDRFMSFRLLEYICAAYRQHLHDAGKRKAVTFPFPLAVVLHHGKTPWKKVLPMRELIDCKPGVSRDFLQPPVCLIDLAQIPSDQLHGHPMICALLDSLQSASTGRLPERATSIFGRLRGIRKESRLKSWSMALATYYASIQGRVQEDIDDLIHVLKSLYSAKEAEKMAGTIADELRLEGKAEGKVEGKVESIIFILESRFGVVPSSLKKKLTGMNDLKRIEKAMSLAMSSQDLKAFQKAL